MLSRDHKERLAIGLADALNAAVEHGLDHRSVDGHVMAFLRDLRGALIEADASAIELEMSSSLFTHSGAQLVAASIRGRRQIEALRACSAGGFVFDQQTNELDLKRLIDFSLAIRGTITAIDSARTMLAGRGVTSVQLLAASDEYEWAPVRARAASSIYERAGFDLLGAAPVYRSMAMVVEEAVDVAEGGGAVNMAAARSIGEQLSECMSARFSDLLHLVERPDFDLFTVQHSLRVALLATYVATQSGVRHEVLTEIAAAALLHDVGKARIAKGILDKPGRLDDDERREIARHPMLGAEILLDSPDVGPCALAAAFGHHLRHDGRGYPETRPWFKRSNITNLIQVSDVFEALTARRPYKEPYSPARAFKILYSDKGAFDPAILAAFTRHIGLYPPGRFVRLGDGRLARVAAVGRVLDRPTVRVLPDGVVVDLCAPEHAACSIVEIVEECAAVKELVGSSHDQAEAAEAAADQRAQLTSDAPEVDPVAEAEADRRLLGGDPAWGCSHGEGCRLC